jgi:hypothetical protein
MQPRRGHPHHLSGDQAGFLLTPVAVLFDRRAGRDRSGGPGMDGNAAEIGSKAKRRPLRCGVSHILKSARPTVLRKELLRPAEARDLVRLRLTRPVCARVQHVSYPERRGDTHDACTKTA